MSLHVVLLCVVTKLRRRRWTRGGEGGGGGVFYIFVVTVFVSGQRQDQGGECEAERRRTRRNSKYQTGQKDSLDKITFRRL